MKSLLEPAIARLRREHPAWGMGGPDGGYFQLNNLRIIVGIGDGWDHVSVSLPDRCPTWDEMCKVKRLFFKEEECVVQYHPAESDYINLNQHALHLWRPHNVAIPMPPKEMV